MDFGHNSLYSLTQVAGEQRKDLLHSLILERSRFLKTGKKDLRILVELALIAKEILRRKIKDII